MLRLHFGGRREMRRFHRQACVVRLLAAANLPSSQSNRLAVCQTGDSYKPERDSSTSCRSRLVCVAFGLIVGGAIGNIVDRLHYGYVIDFIDFYRFPQIWRFTFNVGDSCITAGVVLLLISSVIRTRRHT